MSEVKREVAKLLQSLPDDCSIEDVQYHLYVIEKVHRAIERSDVEGSVSHSEAEQRLAKWRSK